MGFFFQIGAWNVSLLIVVIGLVGSSSGNSISSTRSSNSGSTSTSTSSSSSRRAA